MRHLRRSMAERAFATCVTLLLLAGPVEAVSPLHGGGSGALRLAGPLRRAPEVGNRASRGVETPRGLILKLRRDADVCLSCKVGRGRALGTLVPGSRLDALNRRFGVRSARPLLRAHVRQGTSGGRGVAAERLVDLTRRFPNRARRGSSREAADFSRTYVLRTRRHPDMLAVARTFAADPAVEYCEPDYVMQAASLPNDPFLHSQGSWGQPFSDLWGVYAISAPTAWDVTRGAGVLVAIVDSGIDYTHPDIAANVWTNAGEIPDNGVDDDLNGYVDDVHGWNFVERNANALDDFFHGTHVAGTVAAVGDNGSGIVGVAYESRVMALRGLGTFGYGYTSDLVEAIEYAVDNGADVINASWGGRFFSQTLAAAVADAHAAGVVFVAAAGNDSADVASHFPSALPHAIAVAALTQSDVRADFSNFGVQLDVAAPGGGDGPPPPDADFPDASVLSLKSGTLSPFIWIDPKIILSDGVAQYLRIDGTSMAAPHVSGVAALVLAANPALDVEQVRQVLRTTADDLGSPGFDLDTGAGRVNAERAVLAAPPLVAIITEPLGGSLVGEVAVDIRGSAWGPGFASYMLEYRPAASSEGWAPIVGPVPTQVADGLLAAWDVSSLADGDYVLRLTAERSGETFTDHLGVTLVNAAIDSPPELAALRNDHPIEIRGTAAGAGFTGYQVEYLRRAINPSAWRTDGLTLAAPPGEPVRKGLLATLDASALSEGDRFDFRLTVQNGAGASTVTRAGIVIDPTLKPGWPQPLVGVGDADYLTVADLDSDGVQEILVGSGDEVVVFEPDGSVRPGWPQSVATSEFPFVDTPGSPIVADIAGDSAPEVIATNRSQIFAWTGDGVLLAGFPLLAGNEYYHSGIKLTAGDRDGDGKDEIIASGWGGIWFYRGDGTELPGSALLMTPPATSRIATVAAAQVVGDARVEVSRLDKTYLAGFRGGEISIVGPEGAAIATSKGKFTFNSYPAMADVNGDGILDLHWVSESRHKDRMKVYGLSAFGSRVRIAGACGRGRRGPRWTSAQLSFADLDRDGFAEAYSYETQNPQGWLADEFGRFEDELGFINIRRSRSAGPRPNAIGPNRLFQTSVPGGIAIGDVDGDGQQELVVGIRGRACGPGECRVYGGKNLLRAVVVHRLDGSMLPKFPKPLPQRVVDNEEDFDPYFFSPWGDRRAETPAIADLDGDGLKEVLWVDIISDQLFVWDVTGTPGPLVADWPMFLHDPKHTNSLPLTR